MRDQADSLPGPCFTRELTLMKDCRGPVAGVDEAGRGPWAGPVVAAAVILDPDAIPSGLNDSKKLPAQARDALFAELSATARVGVGIADVEHIERDNILNATMWAMAAAVDGLDALPGVALIDGNRCPALPCPAEALVGGDARSLSVAAASIVAKVTRDRIMCELAGQYPGYGWERNKGYGTREHADGLARLGVSRHHRRSFRPVRDIVERRSKA